MKSSEDAMWCVAAARAGVNTTGQPGVYETTWITDAGLITNPNFRSGGGWNLCNSDWNAVILPVDKIGCGGNDRVWTTPGYDRDEVNRLLAELLNRIANGQSSLEAAAAMSNLDISIFASAKQGSGAAI